MSQETLRKTRYYEIKSDGTFFSNLPKDDRDPEVQDGRTWRHWEFKGEPGKTLGYLKHSVSGYIESLYEDDGPYDTKICMGLRTEDGVDVLQFPKENNFGALNDHVGAIALRWEAIDLDFPVEFSLYVGKPNAKGFTKTYLNVKQFNKPVWPSYEKVEGSNFDYVGVPDVVKTEKMGKVKFNSDDRDEFLYNRLKDLMAKVDKAGHKENRGQTPAEAAHENANSESEDLEEDAPF